MNVEPKQKHNSDKMPIDIMSSQPCIKPNVVRCIGLSLYLGLFIVVSILFSDFCRQSKVSADLNVIVSYLIGVAFGLGLIVFWRNWLEEFV